MTADNQPQKIRGLLIALVAGVLALVAVGAAALLVNIAERKQEAKHAFVKLVEVGEDDVDPAKWGTNWPREYDGYQRTSEPTSTKYGGGAGASEGQPPPQKAERDPWLTRVFAGYLFAVDYRDRRGHAFMLLDQEQHEAQRARPRRSSRATACTATARSCRSTGSSGRRRRRRPAQAEQVQKGLAEVSRDELLGRAQAAGGGLRREGPPGLLRGLPRSRDDGAPGDAAGLHRRHPEARRLGRRVPHLPSVERWRRGDRAKPYDPNLDGTRQEMRSFVCGQCHVEYYCGKGMTLFFPWDEGLKVGADRAPLRQPAGEGPALQGLGPRRDRHGGPQGPAPGVRALEPGHPRAERRRLRRLPHAVQARGRDEDLRALGAQPAPRGEPLLRRLPPLRRRRDQGPRSRPSRTGTSRS